MGDLTEGGGGEVNGVEHDGREERRQEDINGECEGEGDRSTVRENVRRDEKTRRKECGRLDRRQVVSVNAIVKRSGKEQRTGTVNSNR